MRDPTAFDDLHTTAGPNRGALTPHDGSDLAGPAHAMASCGAPQALSFAQHLSGAHLAQGTCYGLLGAVFAFFVCYVTYSYVMVCCAAFANALLSIVVAAPAMIHGQPRRRAERRIKMFFKHAALVFAYTTYISMAAMIVLKMGTRGGYADQVGMSHPLAWLFMIAIVSAVAIGVPTALPQPAHPHQPCSDPTAWRGWSPPPAVCAAPSDHTTAW